MTVENYIRNMTPEQRQLFARVQAIVKKQAPNVQEIISYGMPTFKYKGKYLLAFGAFKDHVSVFPGTEPIEEMADKLGNYKTAKGTIQFTPTHLLPDALLEEIVKRCMSRIDAA